MWFWFLIYLVDHDVLHILACAGCGGLSTPRAVSGCGSIVDVVVAAIAKD